MVDKRTEDMWHTFAPMLVTLSRAEEVLGGREGVEEMIEAYKNGHGITPEEWEVIMARWESR